MSQVEKFSEREPGLSPTKRALLEKWLRGQSTAAPLTRSDRDGQVPLSFAQQRLWFLEQLVPGSPAYHLPQALRLKGALNQAALEQSLNQVIRRHEVLRTTFAVIEGQPVQITAPHLWLPVPLINLMAAPEPERESQVMGLAYEEASRPFNLAQGPLLRATLLQIGEAEYVLLLTLHHIVGDGWSVGILLRETVAAYLEFQAGQSPAWPELPIQYADFALWQRQWLQGQTFEAQLAYWRRQLDGLTPLALPTDYPRPALQSFRGATYSFSVAPEVMAGLKALSQRENVSLFMIGLAAFQVLLYRYTGQTDLAVGSPFANRQRSETEGLIGCFVNTLVLRTRLDSASADPSFLNFLSQVRHVVLEAAAHQDLPFEKLVEVLKPERALSHTPLFQTMFALHTRDEAPAEISGLSLSRVEVERGIAQFDLTLDMLQTASGLAGSLEYNTELFDPATIRQMAGHFQTLLANIAANPTQRLSELNLLTAVERRQLLVDWNSTQTNYELETSLPRLFESQSVQHPDAVAATWNDSSLTYEALNQRANQLAGHLRTLGIGLGDRVALCLERSLETVVAVLGVLKAGGAYVPLDPTYPAERLAFMLEDSAAPVLLTQARLLNRVPQSRTVQAVCLDTHWPLIDQASPMPEITEPLIPADAPAYLIYTSGTTGKPKGVLVPQRAVVNHNRAIAQAYDLQANDRVLQFASLSFDVAVEEMFPAWLTGAVVVLLPEPLALADFIKFVEREQLTILNLPTPYWHTWVTELEQVWAAPPAALRLIVVGTEKVRPDRLADWQRQVGNRVRWHNAFGLTETTITSLLYTPANPTLQDSVSVAIGRPLPNTSAYLLDGYLQPVPIGIAGELYLGGVGVAYGYLNQPALTAERFIPDPFAPLSSPHFFEIGGAQGGARLYRTGDLARYRADGNIELLGRDDQQVKVRGFRIETGEIETVLCQHPSVREAAVLAVESNEETPSTDTQLMAYLVPVTGLEFVPSQPELRRFLQTQLPPYMLPSTFRWLETLPLTPAGKLDRQALPAPGSLRPELEETYAAPRTPVEEVLAQIWKQLLNLNQVGRADNFFALGGHSLLATQMIARLREAFRVELPLRAIFESPTLAELAERIQAASRSEADLPLMPLTRVAREGDLPLSFAQERLWFLDQLAPGNLLYNLFDAVRLTGPLHLAALERSLAEIVKRHESLRTSFVAEEGRPHQVIAPFHFWYLPHVDLSDLTMTMREPEALRLAQAEAARPFQLAQGPLMRATLVRLSKEDHLVLLTMHHIIADDWSVGVLTQELSALYPAFVAGQPSPLSDLSIQYADFAIWQRQRLQAEVLADQLAYWQQQLAGAAVLELPTDRPRPPVQNFRGASQAFALPQRLSEGLQSLSQREGVTLFMTLLAAFQALLQRYSRQDEISIGTPIAGRTQLETENVIGFFTNTLVLRLSLAGNPTLHELLHRVRELTLEADAHQDLPFEKLVEALQPERDLSLSPLFQVMFTLHNAPQPALALPGLTLSQVPIETGGARYDLNLELWETATGLQGAFRYATDLFEIESIQRLSRNFQMLLEAFVAQPEQRLANIALLTAAERRQLLEWNDTQTAYPDSACIHQLIEAQAARSPDAVAAVFEAGHITYAALERKANQLAHHLQSLGVGPEVRVGLCVERSLGLIVGLLGILKAGGSYIPLDPAYPRERLAYMVTDGQASVLVTQQQLLPLWAEIEIPQVYLEANWATTPPTESQALQRDVNAENLAYLIYTSGSTGQPKGVQISHQAVVNCLMAIAHQPGLTAQDCWLALTTISFDIAALEIFLPLMVGARLVIASQEVARDGDQLRAALTDSGATVMQATPVTWQLLLETGMFSRPKLKMLCGGQALPRKLAQALQSTGASLWNLFGPTETTIWSTLYPVDASAEGPVPIGRPMANTQVYVLDSNGQLAPLGVPGELYIGGAGLARGYFRQPALTAERFIPNSLPHSSLGDRLYKTGDLVRWRPNGTLEFLGRVDHQVKIRGFRIELGEIESILSKHSGVREAVVVVRPAESSKAEQRLVAYVVLNPNSQATPHTLRRFLGEHLPEYMLPTAFILLSALPLTPNGKIDRRALPAPAAERPTWLADYEAPQGPQEELLATLWSEVLGIESISRQDNFFSLGGHSLLAAQLISRIRRTFQLELPLITIFEQPTLAGLANGLTRAAQTTSEPQLPLSPVTHDQPLPLSYVQERLWFLDQLTPGNPTYNIASALRLQGPLMIAALIQSVNEVIRRHAILRTTFSNAQGQPLQVIASNLKGTLPVIDLRDIPQPQREAEALRLAAEEARRSFDLSRGPLVRTQVIELDQTEHVALLTIHHIVADGWSMAVLLRELTALYAAYSLGRPSPLPELPVQYADFAVWQRGWLQGETLQSQLAYWKKQIEGTVTLDLPTDYPRPIIQTYAGASTTLRLAQALSESLKTFSRQAGVTLFMSLLAAFKILLQRYTGQDDLSLGSPIAGRTRAEVEPLIGFFINTLVLRTDLSGNPTFRELVGRVRQTTLGAYAHQDIPFEQLLEALQPERDLSRTPLFQILFNMLNFPEVKTRLPSGLTLEHVPTPENGSKFDLTLHVEDQPDGLRFDLVYNPDLFSDARMIELLAQYEFLLQQVLQDPNIPIGQYSLVTPATRPKLPDPTETLDDGWIGAVHEIVSRHARRAPQQVAIVDRQASWTYDTLEVRSNQLAQALQAQGIQRGDIIAIYAHRSAALIWAILGVFKAGAAFVIFDPNLPTARLTKYLQIARPQGWLQIAAAGALPEALATCLKDLGCHCRWELPAEPGPEALNPFSQYPSQAPLVAVGPDDLASIVFTSGSTGQPKVVIGHHGSLTHFMPWFGQTFGMSSTDRFSLLAGIAFDFLQRELFTSLCLGATLCLPDPDYFSTPGWLASWLRQQAITIIHLTPATGQLLTEGVRESIPSLRTAFFIGEALTRGDAARLKQLAPNLTCINLYGSTEGQRAVSYYVIADPLNSQAGAEHSPRRVREIIPLGRGIQDVQLILLNTAQQLAGVGEIGEIYLRSPHLGIGYKDDEALTRERFRLNPFTQRPGDRINKTGDLGRYLPDGNVESLGRADQQVKIRGFRLELGEVEAALRSHAAVRECAVVARHLNTTPEAPARDKRLVAYLVRREAQTQPVTVDQLHRFLKERLPDYMLPAAYVFLEALPLTPTRKVDRQALPAPELIRPELQETFVAPRTPTEEVLAGIWATVLGLEQVGIHDNFFALGGHSLLATRVFSRLRDTFQIEVPLRALFESPTVAGLAEHIEGVRRVAASLATPPIVRAERVGELPLSFSQLRLWFLDQLSPGNAFYNLFHAIRIAGLLDIAAFEHSLQAIIQRHESLQTTFVAVAGRPGQVITDCLPWRLPLIDLSALPSPTRETEARQLARRAAQQPFDLAQGPLLRTTLVYLGDQEHLVLLTLHHIVADEWSLGIFVEEVAAFYTAFVAGQVATLPPLPIQYLDFALWQQRWLQGTTLAGQLEYWQAQLAGLTPLELPTDRPRPAVQTHRGAKQSLSIPLSLTTDLRTLSQQEETTLFMTLLAAFQTLLHRYSGQDEVCVGTPIAGRTRTELENVIGYFANTIVLRTSLAGNPTVRELLQRVRAVTLAAYTHQDLPFEKLVELLQPERDLSRNPLFQILFALHNTPQPTLALPGLALTALEVDTDTARFDLSLDLWEGPHGLQGVFEYNTDLFEAETISRLGEHYKIILAALTAEPQQFLAQLSVLTPVEEQQILQTWNSPPLITPASCLHQLVEAQAARQPDAIALSGSGASLTYSELNRRANQLAHYLQQYGVGPEILVGVYLERSAEVVLALLAILKAGGAYVPLDPAYPTERISFMLADAGASVLLTQTQLAAQLPTPSTPVICLEADWPAIAQFGVSNLQSQTDPDNLAYVIYTSGSTGKPKGVQVSHRSVGSLLAATHELVCGDPQDVWTVFHSYAFDFSVWEIWTPLSQGSRLVVLPVEVTQTPEALHDVLHAEQVTILNQTPSAVRQLLAAHSDNDLSLRALMCGGEAFPGDLAMALLRWGIPVRNFYGPTEATVWAASQVVESEMLIEGTVPVGRPLPNSQIYLLGKQRQLAPIGVPGEIHIGGSGLARGYLHRPELTAEKFIPHPFSPEPGQRLYRTGDLGRYRPDGVVEFLGRLDHQVKIRGFRIELGEIENVLSQHPAIQEVVVLARPPAIGSDSAQLVAYWVPGTEPAPTVTELRGFLKQQLPEYMVPAAFVSLRTLPLTPNGKIDRRALPEPDTTRPTLQAAFVAPRNPREKLLAQIWAELLGLERIGIHDNFFDLGGNSLLVIRIIARAQQAGLAITTRQLFQHQTIAELAQAVGSIHLQAEQGVIVGPAPLSPAQRQFFERNYARPDYYNLATLLEALGPLNPVHLEQAFRVLLVHHDSLRLQLVTEGPDWQQTIAPLGEQVPFVWVNVTALSEAQQIQVIQTVLVQLQTSFNLFEGPLIRMALFEGAPPTPPRLLIVCHYLPADILSWQILLSDLDTTYQQLNQAQPAQLPPKTTSFKEWVERLAHYAASSKIRAEVEYWLDEARAQAGPLPVDYPGGVNTVASVKTVAVQLDLTETQRLIQLVVPAVDAQINEVIFTALAQAFARWTGSPTLLMDLVGHGRESLFEDMDLTRTIGWLNTLFPVFLNLGDALTEPAAALQTVKEQVRRIPNHGVGYGILRYLSPDPILVEKVRALPQAEVYFNYVDELVPQFSLYQLIRIAGGFIHERGGRRGYLLSITGNLLPDGRLQLTWEYSANVHRPETINTLAQDTLNALRTFIAQHPLP